MSSAAEVLVIILSIVLSIFLIVGVVLLIYLIRLSAEIRKIAQSAQKTVDHIENAVGGASRLISPVYVADLIARTIKKFTTSSKKGK